MKLKKKQMKPKKKQMKLQKEQMKPKRKKIAALSAIAILILGIIWIVWGNTSLTTRKITVAGTTLPEEFSGYKIAHVSDLHNTDFGNHNQKLLDRLSDSKANIIVITGDLIDSRHPDTDIALDFAKKAVELAPVYYVTGNHEAKTKEFATLEAGLIECGVRVLRNEAVELENNGQTIQLIGIDDPAFAKTDWVYDTEGYTVLLSHRPELFDVYVSNQIDLVFSGHAHGGQFRLPFVGGLIAPNQGLLPQYDSGLYTKDDTNMIVSRGLGNSIIPFRVNNRTEIVVVTLEKK